MNQHIKKLKKIKASKFWPYFLEHKQELKLILDNDDTIVVPLERDEDEEDDSVSAPSYLGNSEGVSELLSLLDINFEHC